LLTKTQVLDELRAAGHDIPVRTFEDWAAAGLIPRGLRRWHDGRAASLWPRWVVDLALFAIGLRTAGRSLAEARDEIRAVDWPTVRSTTIAPPANRQDAQSRFDAYQDALGDLEAVLERLAALQERITGSPVVTVQVRFINAQGDRVEHAMPLAPLVTESPQE
jgi:hypothetical protein